MLLILGSDDGSRLTIDGDLVLMSGPIIHL